MAEGKRFENVDMIFEGRIRGNQLMLSGKYLTAEEAKLLWESPRMKDISWLDLDDNKPVSYTHLTLPTIYSV